MEMNNMTALISCFARAYHTKNNQFNIYNDPIAEKILGIKDYNEISNNMKNGISFFNKNFKGTKDESLRYIVDNHLSPSVLGRSIFTEEKLNNSKMLGAKQYLILASGYDTSFYKNKELKVFEVDTLEMINDKKSRLNNANIKCTNVEYISANFINKDWNKLIINSNFDRDKKTFCSMLGISYYLTYEQFESFISNVADLLNAGSEIVLDYPNSVETRNEIINQELAKGANEEMKSKYNLKDIEKICEKNNLLVYENLNSNDITRMFFYDYNTLNPNHKIVAPKGISYCLLVKR